MALGLNNQSFCCRRRCLSQAPTEQPLSDEIMKLEALVRWHTWFLAVDAHMDPHYRVLVPVLRVAAGTTNTLSFSRPPGHRRAASAHPVGIEEFLTALPTHPPPLPGSPVCTETTLVRRSNYLHQSTTKIVDLLDLWLLLLC
jgi:hypothetical protein